MSPVRRSGAEERFQAAYDRLLAHGAGCDGCRGPVAGAQSRTCPEGHRLFAEHQKAKRGLRTERTETTA